MSRSNGWGTVVVALAIIVGIFAVILLYPTSPLTATLMMILSVIAGYFFGRYERGRKEHQDE